MSKLLSLSLNQTRIIMNVVGRHDIEASDSLFIASVIEPKQYAFYTSEAAHSFEAALM